MTNDELKKAELLRDQVMKTWSPPRLGMGRPADVAQTSMMLGLAWVFGKSFFGDLTENQNEAIDSGLELMSRELLNG